MPPRRLRRFSSAPLEVSCLALGLDEEKEVEPRSAASPQRLVQPASPRVVDDLHDLGAAGASAQDAYPGARNIEVFGQGRDERFVGLSLARWGGDCDAEVTRAQALNARASRSRDDIYRNAHRSIIFSFLFERRFAS